MVLSELMAELRKRLVPFLKENELIPESWQPGQQIRCLSPQHTDSTPSAGIIGDDLHKFNCQGCGYSGDIFDAHSIVNPSAV